MKTAVVILNWNGQALLERFLPDLLAHSQSFASVHVVDNASTDESVSFVHSNFPNVNVIRHQHNLGYAEGYNQTIGQIDAELLCLINNDVQTPEGWLQPMINAFKNDPLMALAQPKILDLNRPTHFEYAGAAGGFLDRFGFPYCRGRIFYHLEEDHHQYTTAEVFWASGACLFVRKTVFQSLKGFDASFFAHMEEIDLCWRAKLQGFQVWAIAESHVFHLGGGTLHYGTAQKTRLNFRNSLFMLLKNTQKHLMFLLVIRLLLDGLAAWRFLLQGKPSHFGAVFMAHMDLYRQGGRYLKSRSKSLKSIVLDSSIVWKYYILGRKTFDKL